MEKRVIRGGIIGAAVAVALLCAAGATGCGDLDLGDAPFRCNEGKPKCPEGYECKNGVCVREGPCPWPAVPSCPAPPPKAKFCHNLALSSGTKVTLELRIGSVPLIASTSNCSGCKNIPAGDQKVALHIKGNKTPETTTQLYVKGGVQYLHVANVDAQKKVSVQRVVIPSGVTCEEAKPAW